MAYSGPCREPAFYAEVLRPAHHVLPAPNIRRSIDETNSAGTKLAELMSNRGRYEGLRLREIQFHADAIRVVHEELRIAGARHDAFAEFDVVLLQALAHPIDVGRGKRDVVEAAGVLIFLLGAAHHDAVARLARAHQVNGGDAARIEPVAGEI